MICIWKRADIHHSCAQKGSVELADKLEKQIQDQGLDVEVERVECMGECKTGPTMRIAPGGRFFAGVSMDNIQEVMEGLTEALKKVE